MGQDDSWPGPGCLFPAFPLVSSRRSAWPVGARPVAAVSCGFLCLRVGCGIGQIGLRLTALRLQQALAEGVGGLGTWGGGSLSHRNRIFSCKSAASRDALALGSERLLGFLTWALCSNQLVSHVAWGSDCWPGGPENVLHVPGRADVRGPLGKRRAAPTEHFCPRHHAPCWFQAKRWARPRAEEETG